MVRGRQPSACAGGALAGTRATYLPESYCLLVTAWLWLTGVPVSVSLLRHGLLLTPWTCVHTAGRLVDIRNSHCLPSFGWCAEWPEITICSLRSGLEVLDSVVFKLCATETRRIIVISGMVLRMRLQSHVLSQRTC